MLFVITHRHPPDLCLADDPAPVHRLAAPDHISEAGVKVVGSYLAPPEHTFFFVLEADDYAQVVRFLRPIMKIGTPDIVPVQTIEDSLGLFPDK